MLSIMLHRSHFGNTGPKLGSTSHQFSFTSALWFLEKKWYWQVRAVIALMMVPFLIRKSQFKMAKNPFSRNSLAQPHENQIFLCNLRCYGLGLRRKRRAKNCKT